MNKPSYPKDAPFPLIYIYTSHSSIVTTEINVKFTLRQLDADFPLLVNSTKNTKTQKVRIASAVPLNSIISGLKIS